jgi:hypothetical protein
MERRDSTFLFLEVATLVGFHCFLTSLISSKRKTTFFSFKISYFLLGLCNCLTISHVVGLHAKTNGKWWEIQSLEKYISIQLSSAALRFQKITEHSFI